MLQTVNGIDERTPAPRTSPYMPRYTYVIWQNPSLCMIYKKGKWSILFEHLIGDLLFFLLASKPKAGVFQTENP